MNHITLELVTEGVGQTLTLPIVAHVHKRIERFTYSNSISASDVPLVYMENKDLDSWRNLQIANRTYGVPANAPRIGSNRVGWSHVTSTSYTGPYKEMLITNVTGLDSRGKRRPLFWKHVLPDSTVEATLYMVQNGNRIDVDDGFLQDLDTGALYTNYSNFHNPDTGAYRLYYVVSSDSDEVVTHSLLNLVPVVGEATWEDIDPDTGTFYEGRVVYTREQSGSGWTFYFSDAGTYYVRPQRRSIIQPLKPAGREPDTSWKIRFSNGEVSTLVNERLRRYWIPEYDLQPFFPVKPCIFSDYQGMVWVNNRTLASTRNSLMVDPSNGLHFALSVFDSDGVLIRVLTTDTSLDGSRYSNTDVFYEADKILSWDERDGMIGFGIDILPSWTFAASYFYLATDYEYSYLDFNPVTNPSVMDYMYVFYIVPDVDEDDQAIHHLVVDREGIIVGCSQAGGVQVPNLQLLNSGGNYNSNTIIGLRYISEEEEDTFMSLYGVGGDNNRAYYVLSEVVVVDTFLQESMQVIDVSRRGGCVVPARFADVIRANPTILQSSLGYGENGMTVPKNAVIRVRVPITVLEEYGGGLTKDRVVELLKRHNNAAVSLVVEYEYPNSTLSATSLVVAEVDLSLTWEGDNLTYNLYSRGNGEVDWALITSFVDPARGTLTYTDETEAGVILQYGVRIVRDTIEYPFGNLISIMTRS